MQNASTGDLGSLLPQRLVFSWAGHRSDVFTNCRPRVFIFIFRTPTTSVPGSNGHEHIVYRFLNSYKGSAFSKCFKTNDFPPAFAGRHTHTCQRAGDESLGVNCPLCENRCSPSGFLKQSVFSSCLWVRHFSGNPPRPKRNKTIKTAWGKPPAPPPPKKKENNHMAGFPFVPLSDQPSSFSSALCLARERSRSPKSPGGISWANAGA